MTLPASNIGSLQLGMIDGPSTSSPTTKAVSGFGDMLKTKLTELNESQAAGDQAGSDMATGRVNDVAQTMMRIEQANVTLQMATQIRNKAVEAYQEIMRMQV